MSRHQPIFFIALGLFGLYCIEFGVVGILPVIIDRFSVTPAKAGWLVGLFALVIAVLGPFLVLLASRLRRKRILIISLLVFAGVSVASAYAPAFDGLLWLRVLPALFHPIYFSLAMVTAMSLYPKEQTTQATAHAFIGTSMGMVLGIPITTWVADQFSYQASFLFCAAVNLAAAIGLIISLPEASSPQRLSYGSQLAILKKPALWLNIAASTLIFAAMFSVYAYAAQYLTQQTHLDARAISLLLILFGVGGVLGNLLAARWLSSNKVRTTLLHPIALGTAYCLLYALGSPTMPSMIAIMLFWGAAHTSGLIVTQVWLTSETQEAPEFGTGLYISFINLGVTVGSMSAGWFIDWMGMTGTIVSGLLFAGLAVLVIGTKVLLDKRKLAHRVSGVRVA